MYRTTLILLIYCITVSYHKIHSYILTSVVWSTSRVDSCTPTMAIAIIIASYFAATMQLNVARDTCTYISKGDRGGESHENLNVTRLSAKRIVASVEETIATDIHVEYSDGIVT